MIGATTSDRIGHDQKPALPVHIATALGDGAETAQLRRSLAAKLFGLIGPKHLLDDPVGQVRRGRSQYKTDDATREVFHHGVRLLKCESRSTKVVPTSKRQTGCCTIDSIVMVPSTSARPRLLSDYDRRVVLFPNTSSASGNSATA